MPTIPPSLPLPPTADEGGQAKYLQNIVYVRRTIQAGELGAIDFPTDRGRNVTYVIYGYLILLRQILVSSGYQVGFDAMRLGYLRSSRKLKMLPGSQLAGTQSNS